MITCIVAYLHYKLGDHAKGVEEGVAQTRAQSVETVTPTGVCTEMEVMETTNDDDLGNDTAQQQAETLSSESVEAKEESFNEDTPLPTAFHHTISQADKHMEMSHVSYNLLDISSTPVMVAHATVDFIGQNNNFLKGCKWYN